MVRASRTRTCRCPMPRWRERRPGGSPGSASTSRSAPLPAGPQDLRRDICLGTQRAPSWSAVRRRPAPDSRRCPVRITSAIWSISPVMTRNSRQSSVLVPTIRSALRAGASAIRSIGAPGMISPSITRLPRHHTGRHLGAPALRIRMGEEIRFQLPLCGEQPLHEDRGDRLPRRRHTQLLGQILSDPLPVFGRDHMVCCARFA
jgi:hypothetical protein